MLGTISDLVEFSYDTFQKCQDTDLHACDIRDTFWGKMDVFRKSKKSKSKTKTPVEFPMSEWIQFEITLSDLKSLQRAQEKICNFKTSHIGVRKIDAKKWKSDTPTCGICLESHSYRDSITTSCKHHFGKECFYHWIHTNMVKETSVVCPYCRSDNYTIFRYKRRS